MVTNQPLYLIDTKAAFAYSGTRNAEFNIGIDRMDYSGVYWWVKKDLTSSGFWL